MNVILCCDEKFAMPCAACMVSIFENVPKEDEYEIMLLTDGFTPKTEEKLHSVGRQYNRKINIIRIDDSMFDGLKVTYAFPRSAYYRYLIPKLLPNESKALYMDCDMIVLKSLKLLWETDIEGKALAAVPDQTVDDVRHNNRTRTNEPYFNSGMLLMNLNYWRDNDITKKCVDYIAENPERCFYPDQDALNHVLEGKVVYLPWRYNFQQNLFDDIEKSLIHHSKWDTVEKEKENIVIMHYCHVLKPWFTDCVHPHPEYFRECLAKTPWANYHMYARGYHPNSFLRKVRRNLRKWFHI